MCLCTTELLTLRRWDEIGRAHGGVIGSGLLTILLTPELRLGALFERKRQCLLPVVTADICVVFRSYM